MSIYGTSDQNDITQRFGPDPAVNPPDFQKTAYTDPSAYPAAAHTVVQQPRDDSAGYTVPEQRTHPTSLPTQPLRPPQPSQPTQPFAPSQPSAQPSGPGPMPQRIPAQYAPPPSQFSNSGGNGPSTGPSTSIRIGKGVTAAVKPGRSRSGRPWWGYLTRILSWILTAVIIAVLLWTAWQWWQRQHNATVVGTVTVAPAELFNNQCNVQYDIVGTIATNGKAGTITYEWVRSDGQRSGPLKQSVGAGQRSIKVHLNWKFTGEGTMNATATLHVRKPSVVDGSAQFVYSCQ